jgi:hypothetical protein
MTRKMLATAALVLVLVGLATCMGLATNGQKEVDFVEAVEHGLIEFQIHDIHGLVSIDLDVRNRSTDDSLRIVILPGVVFYSVDDEVQDLVVVRKVVALVAPGEHKTVTVPIACADMTDAQPTSGTQFENHIGRMNLSTLQMLVQSDAYQEATFRIQQFALWLLIDQPETRYDFSGLGLGGDFFSTFESLFDVSEDQLESLCLTFAMYPERIMALPDDEYFTLSIAFTVSGIPIKDRQDLYDLFTLGIPIKGELAQIYSLFETAGIDPTGFPVLAASTMGTT